MDGVVWSFLYLFNVVFLFSDMQYFIVLQCLLIHLIQKVYLKMHCFLIIKFVGYSSFCKGIVVGIKQKNLHLLSVKHVDI